ncbi:MAG: endonuclease III domain-containing protein [Desulfobulbus sp.]|jgi:endonuclease-3 related protein|uniref:endonuclease III domain-containing protein n=1 Tax=Desulfobulbus sp. TaxID=895 RepID=UPI002851ACBA|nr:endonuclease III domain-containing protein [Desulfobulbus sp.]MDR2549852.1 endonuclease III domain-containing protein [Desulfobulbus sp.]
MATADRLREIYDRMLAHWGPQHWWPAETPLEVMVGAILTQNTAWKNVERAIVNLKGAGVLSLTALAELPTALLAEYIRPAGYYNIKAGRLHNLLHFITDQHGDDLQSFLAQPLPQLREQLLSVKGVGRETADSILLYAAGLPMFVVDAYTHRILVRHQVIDEDFGYEAIQELFMDNLECDVQLYNEYHALLVRVGNVYCKKKNPACVVCPLQGM